MPTDIVEKTITQKSFGYSPKTSRRLKDDAIPMR